MSLHIMIGGLATVLFLIYIVFPILSSISFKRKCKKDRQLRDNIEKVMKQKRIPYEGFLVIDRSKTSIDIAVTTEAGYKTGDKYHIDVQDGKMIRIRPYSTNIKRRDNPDKYSMDELKEKFAKKLSTEAAQLSMIEQKIREEGEATIYAQSFNDNNELTKREMKAIVEVLKEDNFKVCSSDYMTGEILLVIDSNY